jgi:hypothetical protein
MERHLAAILAADVAGYSSQISNLRPTERDGVEPACCSPPMTRYFFTAGLRPGAGGGT